MKKQTALDWYIEQMQIVSNTWNLISMHNTEEIMIHLNKLKEKAKEMEKEQIQKAYGVGYLDYNKETHDSPEEYYNETYGGKQALIDLMDHDKEAGMYDVDSK